MSTAGKVLVVFIMLGALTWLILAGGVAQLNRNGNQALEKLATELEKVQASLEHDRHEIGVVRDQTQLVQQNIDREVEDLRSRQADLERARSQIVESLTRVQYELAIVDETIKTAQTSLENRNTEHQEEMKAIEGLRAEAQNLKTENDQFMARLQSLRDKFQSTYHTNLEMLNKRQ